MKALQEGIESFHSNYNEFDDRDLATEVLEHLYKLTSLKTVDFVGNVDSLKFNKAASAAFE